MELLLKLADVIDENAEELARLESRNVGKPWWVAVDEPRRHVGQPPLLRGRGAQPRGQGRGRVRRGLHVDDPARAARRRRRDRALELPALHGDLEAGPGARRRERPDHQARRADAAHRPPLRRARAGGPPAGRPPGRDRGRRPGRRPARPPPVGAPRLADRRHRDGEADREERGRHGQARPPRARRQGADGRARRRRPGDCRRGDQDRRVLQLGPGLHGLLADPRLGARSTTTSSPRPSPRSRA